MESPETVLLISSASRTPYVRDILDVVCYPHLYTMQFRYLPLWLSADLRDPETIEQRLHNRSGVVVFADIIKTMEGEEYRFYPIRLVTIVQPRFVGPVLYVPMVLHDFVDYGPRSEEREQQWHKEINSLPGIPQIRQEPGKESSFVLKATIDPSRYKRERPATFAGWKRAETGWESVIEVLATTDRFRESSFYRIESLTNDAGAPILPTRKGTSAYYKLKFDSKVRIQLCFYHRRAEYIEGRKLKVCANPDLFSGDVGRSISADYQYNRTEVRLLTKRRFERDLSTIRIEPDEWNPSPSDIQVMAARRADHVFADRGSPAGEFLAITKEAEAYIHERIAAGDFFAAAPEIVVELSPPWHAIMLAAVLLVLGTILVSLPPDSIKFMLGRAGVQPNATASWAAFVRSVGGLFAFVGVVYVFRRWPLK